MGNKLSQFAYRETFGPAVGNSKPRVTEPGILPPRQSDICHAGTVQVPIHNGNRLRPAQLDLEQDSNLAHHYDRVRHLPMSPWDFSQGGSLKSLYTSLFRDPRAFKYWTPDLTFVLVIFYKSDSWPRRDYRTSSQEITQSSWPLKPRMLRALKPENVKGPKVQYGACFSIPF